MIYDVIDWQEAKGKTVHEISVMSGGLILFTDKTAIRLEVNHDGDIECPLDEIDMWDWAGLEELLTPEENREVEAARADYEQVLKQTTENKERQKLKELVAKYGIPGD